MPCTYDPTPYEIELENKRIKDREEREKEKRRIERRVLDETTALLCDAVKRIPKTRLTPKLKAWKEEHAKSDARRKAKRK